MTALITLGGVALDDNMVWLERYFAQSIAQSVKTTLGGSPVIFAKRLRAGYKITLQATNEYGWLPTSTVNQLKAMADEPGAVYSLQFGAQTISVVFRNNESPSVDMTPFVPAPVQADTDYQIGQIKLLAV